MVRRVALLAALALAACGDERPAGVGGAYGGTNDAAIPPPREVGTAPAVDTGVADEGPVEVIGGYPVGPYGKSKGATFPPVSLSGYRDGSLAWTTISMREYFDPDGTKGIRGVMVIAAAQWCGVCQNEVKWVTAAYTNDYRAKGARFITTLLQNGDRKASTQATATLWRDNFSIPYAVAIDPTWETLPTDRGTLSLPYSYVIDPRTMRIVEITSAAQTPPNIPTLDALLEKNR